MARNRRKGKPASEPRVQFHPLHAFETDLGPILDCPEVAAAQRQFPMADRIPVNMQIAADSEGQITHTSTVPRPQ